MPATQTRDSSRQTYVAEKLFSATDIATTTSTKAVTGFGPTKSLRAQLNVSKATGGSPKVDVTIEDTLDGTNWNTIGTFAQKVATGREVINITTPFADKIRATATISGTTTAISYDIIIASEIDPT